MNIAFIGAFTGIGGIQKTTALLASELSGCYTVFYIDYRGDDEFRYPLDKKVKTFEVADSKNIGRLMSLMDNLAEKYSAEVGHICNILYQNHVKVAVFCGSFCTALIPLIKAVNPEIKTVAWQRNSFEQYTGRYSEKYKHEYLSGVRSADVVISLTNEDAEKFAKLNVNSVCIYNPVSISHQRRYNNEANRFIFVGRATVMQKGLDLLIESFNMINNEKWSLCIVGDKENKEVIDLVNESAKASQISLVTDKFGDALTDEYMNSSIFILPSRWEGFGVAMVEAMSYGLPIISTPTSGANEVLGNGKYGLIANSFSVDDISEAMKSLAINANLRAFYSKQSTKRVKDFSVNKIVPLWDSLFAKIAEQSPKERL